MTMPFMQRALLEAILVGALAGIVGVHVVLRQLPFFSLTIAHGTFPGVVLAEIAGISLFLGGVGAAVVITIVVFAAGRDRRFDTSVVTGIALSATFALGVLLLSTRDGSAKNLSAFLVGSILTVDRSDVWVTAIVGIGILGVLGALHKEFVFGAFDPGGAKAAGYPRRLDLLLMLLVAMTVVVSLPVVGTILAVTLIAVPALTARLWADRIATTALLAAIFGAGAGVVGLTASAQWNVAAGGAIAVAATGFFGISLLIAPHRTT